MVIPEKLKKGDQVRIVAPATSLSVFTQQSFDDAVKALESLGLAVSFGKHVNQVDIFRAFSASAEARADDLNDAFADPEVKAIFAAWGGFNSNSLLNHIDYDLIKANPKIFCGYSDITILSNAIYQKTGLVTYLGIDFSQFALAKKFSYTLDRAKEIFFESDRKLPEIKLETSEQFCLDKWAQDASHKSYFDFEKARMEDNPGPQVIRQGRATGKIISGNLRTLLLLQGTEFMPCLKDSILFLEETAFGSGFLDVSVFERNIQSLVQSKDFEHVKGLVFGRFDKGFDMTQEKLEAILACKTEIDDIPIVSGVDFGHTNPSFTVPVGGWCVLAADDSGCTIELVEY